MADKTEDLSKIFGGLEDLGFDANEISQIKAENEKTPEKAKKPEASLEDYLLLKTYTCPVCGKEFKNWAVRDSKVRLVSSDTDLKLNYTPVDPLHYGVILCDCGYAAMPTYFSKLTDKQIELIEKRILPKYKRREYPMIYTHDDAIERFKLALLNAITKNAKASENAMICLRIAWLSRDAGNREDEDLFLDQAYLRFMEAITKESFPICGMDNNTMNYLLGDICRRLKKYDDGLRFLSLCITASDASVKIKDRARTVKELIAAATAQQNKPAAK